MPSLSELFDQGAPFHDHSSSWGEDEFDYRNDFSEEEESYGWQALLHRFLKEKKDDGRMDYSALSVAVMTLGLIMVVEVLRHRLDHAAMGKPYFVAVLENIYAECKHA